jgi:hypothetical protein
MICDLVTQVRSAHGILVRKSGVKRPLIKLKPIQGDNIKLDLRDILNICVDWFHLGSDGDQLWALVSMVINLRVHKRDGISSTAEQLQLGEINRNALKAETTRKT